MTPLPGVPNPLVGTWKLVSFQFEAEGSNERLVVPMGVFVGHDALDKFAGDLRATHPHFVYTPHGEAQALHNGGILAWGSGPKGEAPVYTGLDVVIVRDGKSHRPGTAMFAFPPFDCVRAANGTAAVAPM